VTGDTRLVLVNALHVLASWAKEFDFVSPGDFHLPSGEVVRVPMMAGGAATAYQRGDGWQAALLPYRGADAPTLGMTVVLPDPGRILIHDLAHGTPLFVGRVEDPRQP
jgi:serine protease inhibitor